MYPILDSELRELVSGYSSVNLALFGVTMGVFVSTLLTYLTVPLSVSLSTKFFCATTIFGIAALYFGAMAARDWYKSSLAMNGILKETVDVAIREEAQPNG